MSEWKTYKLGDVINLVGGGTPKTTIPEYWNGNIPWLSVVDFGKGIKKVYQTEKTITEKGLKESSTKILKKGQIIISARGTVGELAVLGRDMAFNQSCYGIYANKETENNFLYYLLKYSIGKIKKNTHGAVFDTITKQTFENIEVSVPDLSTQTAIAQILSSLDDKIELNLSMNQTLEAMAQAVFKEWFVDFNYPGFDGELVGGLPKGWRNAALGDATTLIAGGDKPNDFSEQPNEHNGVPIYSNGISNEGLYGYTKKPRIIEESVTVSARGTIGFVCLRLRPYFPIVRLISVIPKSEILTAKYLYYWLINQNISGTGTTQQQLTVPDFGRFNILIPDIHVVAEFTTIVDAFYQKIDENKTQIKSLTQTRDTLLLKLMSGQLEVKK